MKKYNKIFEDFFDDLEVPEDNNEFFQINNKKQNLQYDI